jgi:hypothetical protein
MNASATVMVRFSCLGLLGIGLAACAGESASTNGPLQIYGVGWSGDIGSATSDTLMVEACWNDACRSQVVPIAGLALASSWDQYRPPDPPAGSNETRRPSQVPWTAPKAGECRTFMEWDDDMGISSCAATAGANASEVRLQVFLDLTAVKSALRTGDDVSLRVTNAASDASLIERTTPIERAAPYYVSLEIEE